MRILVTAGPTREYLDPVRYLSNASSGKMGFSIAAEAARRGHHVVLISGPVELPSPPGVDLVRVVSTKQMLEACLSRFEGCDAAIMAAAVCDYRPVRRAPRKIKRQTRGRSIRLVPTEDICRRLGTIKGNRVVIGFALEDRNYHRHAEIKLHCKHCDAIVLNRFDVIGADEAEIEFFQLGRGWSKPAAGTKLKVAARIMDLAESLVRSRVATPDRS